MGTSTASQQFNVLLVGRSLSGKSSLGNTLLGQNYFQTCSETLKTEVGTTCIHGNCVLRVIDTPDIIHMESTINRNASNETTSTASNSNKDTQIHHSCRNSHPDSQSYVRSQIKLWKTMTSPRGPDVILYAVRSGWPFTAEDYAFYTRLKIEWDDPAFCDRLVLAFNFWDCAREEEVKDKRTRVVVRAEEGVVSSWGAGLQGVMRDAGHGYVTFSNQACWEKRKSMGDQFCQVFLPTCQDDSTINGFTPATLSQNGITRVSKDKRISEGKQLKENGEGQRQPVRNQLGIFKHASSSLLEGLPRYTMKNTSRGLCVIINNTDFYRDYSRSDSVRLYDRPWSNADRDKLQSTFTQLGLHVESHNELTHTAMLRLMQRIALYDHTASNVLVCCILTHGECGQVYGVNGVKVRVQDLTKPLRTSACPSLAGKPKVVMLQASFSDVVKRGDSEVKIVAEPEPWSNDLPMIPNEPDFLFSCTTLPVPAVGPQTTKTTGGSSYISTLTHLLHQHSSSHDVVTILTMTQTQLVTEDLAHAASIVRHLPSPKVTLRKLLFLHPVN